MKTILTAIMLLSTFTLSASASPAPPIGCPTCIQNTASPQVAQINIGTATIRGTLTVPGTLNVGTFVVTTLTATNIVGSGSGITALNASQLTSGTVPSARLAGSYTGITAVGTIAAGVWNGTAIGTQYGGTGKNWSAVNVGALPYFDATGSMTTLAAGASTRLLQANGAGAPSWTAAPTVLGTNITAIPLANLSNGNLPSGVKATDASLVTVSGSKVSGDISGDAAGITGTLNLNKLEAGTLAANIIAQTLDNIGTPAGTWGGPTVAAQITTNNQGRVTNITQFAIPGVSTRTAWIDQDNNWHGAAQTSQSTWTFKSDVGVQGTLALTNALAVTSGGTGRATLTANALTYGLGSSAIGLLPVLGNGGLVIGTGAVPSTGTLTGTANQVIVTNAAGKITLSAPQDIGTGSSPTFAALTLTAPLTTANGGTGNNWSATASGGVPYFSAAGTFDVLPKSVNGYTLTLSGGLPVWSAASSSATHLSGGTAGAIPYQSAPNATAFLPAMSDGSIVIGAGFGVAPTTGTLTGTSDQVVVTRNGAGIVLSGPQNLGTGNSPTFAGLTLSSPLTVANGGTGLATLTANGVLVGNGTGNLINLPAMGANGIITGSGTSVQPSTGTLTGTTNRVTVTQTGSNIVLSGPQDLGTGSSPTFVTVTAALSGNATTATTATTATNIAAGGVGQMPYQSGAATTIFLPAMAAGGIITGNGTSAVPSTGTFTGTANQVIITRTGSNIVLSAPQDLGTGSSPTFVTVTAALSGNATTATTATTATNIAGGAAGRIPMQTASGTTTLLPAMGALGIIVGNGTSAVASTATLQGTASQVTVTQTGTAVTLSLPATINVNTSGTAAAVAAGAIGQINYQSGAGVTAFLPAMAAGGIISGNGTSAIPSTGTFTGTSNQVVITRTGSNIVLSLPQSINSGATPTFTGTNFTGIPAAGIGSGTLAIARGGTNLSSAGGTANRVLTTTDGSVWAAAQILGPMVAASTLPVSALNQSGAATNNVIAWNGSNWAPTAPAAASPPTYQYLTSGTGATYTTPANTTKIAVECVGGGGGGAGSDGAVGGDGGTTTFNSINAAPGIKGPAAAASANGAGGTGGTGTAAYRIAGGNPPFGVPWSNSNGIAGPANSGIGGSGAMYNSGGRAGGSGGNGEYFFYTITTPGASYTYTIGTSGAGGTGTYVGGAGGTGFCKVTEYH